MEIASSDTSTPFPFFTFGDPAQQDIMFGAGCVANLGKKIKELGSRALLVTDHGLVQAGHVTRMQENLENLEIKVFTFDQSIENPTDSSVQACADFARPLDIDVIIGFGGGSSMDTAKGCNFILTNGGKMADYWGVGKASRAMLPLVAVPTTAGTGSECQSFALISNDETHQKMACGDPKALPCLTVLDPELTISQPPRVAACTGIDALAHALESAVTSKRNSSSSRHSMIAFKLIEENLPQVLADPTDLKARGQLLVGASHAGAAIERSMLGAAHAMANPLTAHKGVVHGIAVGISLPGVMMFNSQDAGVCSIYAQLSRLAHLSSPNDSDAEATEALIKRVHQLLGMADLPKSLTELGFSAQEVGTLADNAAEQWTASFNPRMITSSDFENLYSQLLEGSHCDFSASEGK